MLDYKRSSGVFPEKRKQPVNKLKNNEPKLKMSAL